VEFLFVQVSNPAITYFDIKITFQRRLEWGYWLYIRHKPLAFARACRGGYGRQWSIGVGEARAEDCCCARSRGAPSSQQPIGRANANSNGADATTAREYWDSFKGNRRPSVRLIGAGLVSRFTQDDGGHLAVLPGPPLRSGFQIPYIAPWRRAALGDKS